MDLFSPESRVMKTKKPHNLRYKLAARADAVVVRVVEVSPRGGDCIVEYRACSTIAGLALQLCHCFGRANSLDDDLMSSIEYNWGMDRGSLYIDSRWNCFYAGSDFHLMFDAGLWCLLPELETLTRYSEAMVKDNEKYGVHLKKEMEADDLSPEGNAPISRAYHTYTMLAFNPAMKRTPIHRHNVKEPGMKDSDITRYVFPFNQPEPLKIESHIHPKFVILSLGQRLSSCILVELREMDHISPFESHLALLGDIYDAWTEPLTPEKLNDASFHTFYPSKQPSKNSTDHRSYKGTSAKTKTSKQSTAPTRSSKRLAGCNAPNHVENEELVPAASTVTSAPSVQSSNETSGGRVPLVVDNSSGDIDEGNLYDDEEKLTSKRRAESPPMGTPGEGPSSPSDRNTRAPMVKKPRM